MILVLPVEFYVDFSSIHVEASKPCDQVVLYLCIGGMTERGDSLVTEVKVVEFDLRSR